MPETVREPENASPPTSAATAARRKRCAPTLHEHGAYRARVESKHPNESFSDTIEREFGPKIAETFPGLPSLIEGRGDSFGAPKIPGRRTKLLA